MFFCKVVVLMGQGRTRGEGGQMKMQMKVGGNAGCLEAALESHAMSCHKLIFYNSNLCYLVLLICFQHETYKKSKHMFSPNNSLI